MTKLVTLLALAGAAVCLSADAQDQSTQHQPTSTELSRDETPGKAFLRTFEFQQYDVRSAAEAMPEDKWDFRPAAGLFKNEKPEFGPAEMRTFRELVKHVACAKFAFAAELEAILEGVQVEAYDERLTTRMAEASRRAGASVEADSLAAAHLLESYLESARG